jgi:antitoxin CcdA
MNEPVTVELDSETLARARAAGLDLSVELKRALHRILPPPKLSDEERKRAADQWYAENKDAVDAYNEYVEKHGLFSDGMRTF